MSINAFVIRKPDENKVGVYEYLLKKNAAMYSVAFAVNELGDIYLVGRLPLDAVTEREIDRILGEVLQYADSSFNPKSIPVICPVGLCDSCRSTSIKKWQ